jgi:hypothetical protein
LRVLDADGAEARLIDENSEFNILFNTEAMQSMPVLTKKSSISKNGAGLPYNTKMFNLSHLMPVSPQNPQNKKQQPSFAGGFKLIHNSKPHSLSSSVLARNLQRPTHC